MGTVLQVTLCGPDPATLSRAATGVLATVDMLDEALTTFSESSPLTQLNRAAGAGPVRLPQPTLAALRSAARLARTTQGTFDPTVGPLVELWRAAQRAGQWPTAAARARAREAVGIDGLEINQETARLSRPGARIDLGGIGKGWALDRTLPDLQAVPGLRALLDFGGSSHHAIGGPPGEELAGTWRVAIADPEGHEIAIVRLRDAALSVSASRGQVWRIGERSVGHVMDPRTGETVESARVAAVVAPDGATAEAFSTALVVWGVAGLAQLTRGVAGVEALVVEAGGEVSLSEGASAFELSGRNATSVKGPPPRPAGRD